MKSIFGPQNEQFLPQIYYIFLVIIYFRRNSAFLCLHCPCIDHTWPTQDGAYEFARKRMLIYPYFTAKIALWGRPF